MFNYNREGFLGSHEASVKEFEAARRQLPVHLRKDSIGEARAFLAAKAIRPVLDVSLRALAGVTVHGGRYWRRASSRARGLVLNPFTG